MGKPKSVKLAQAKGVRRKSSARGQAYGSKRGVPDKQVHRTEVRYADPRVKTSMAEAREAQRRLEAQMAVEAEQPALGPTEGAQYVAERDAAHEAAERAKAQAAQEAEKRKQERLRDGHLFEPWEGEGRNGWTVGAARKMLKQGYAVPHVMKVTGVGYRWLNDVPTDGDHRGLADAS